MRRARFCHSSETARTAAVVVIALVRLDVAGAVGMDDGISLHPLVLTEVVPVARKFHSSRGSSASVRQV